MTNASSAIIYQHRKSPGTDVFLSLITRAEGDEKVKLQIEASIAVFVPAATYKRPRWEGTVWLIETPLNHLGRRSKVLIYRCCRWKECLLAYINPCWWRNGPLKNKIGWTRIEVLLNRLCHGSNFWCTGEPGEENVSHVYYQYKVRNCLCKNSNKKSPYL